MATYYFNGFAGYDWTDNILDQNSGAIVTTSWTSNGEPTTGDDVELGPGSPTSTITLNRNTYNHTNTPVSVHSVTIDSGMTLAEQAGALSVSGTFTNNGVYTKTSNAAFALNLGSTIVNNGLMTIDGVYDYRTVNLAGGTVTISGTGNLRLRDRANIVGADNNAITYLENYSTISGSGTIGQVANYNDPGGYVIVHNHGTIDADLSTSSGALLTLMPRATPAVNPITNDGLIEATNGGQLNLQATNVDQTGSGAIGAYGAGSLVLLTGGDRLRGGTIDGSNGGVVQFGDSGSVDSRSTTAGGLGTITIASGGILSTGNNQPTFLGTISNKGTIRDSNTMIIGSGGLTLSGGGTVQLNGSIGGYDTTSTVVLHNVDNTITGFGNVGRYRSSPSSADQFLDIDNQASGAIVANTANQTLQIIYTNVANAGLLEAQASGTLALNGAIVTQTGSGANAGAIIIDGTSATLSLGYGAVVDGGLIAGVNSGVITAADATFDGSTAAGVVTIQGGVNATHLTLKGAINDIGNINVIPHSAGLYLDASGVTLTGGGKLTLVDNGYDTASVNAAGSGAVLHNVSTTINGAGALNVALDNQAGGTVDADMFQVNQFTFGAPVTNAGLIESTGNGQLAFNGTVVTQTGSGTLKADGASASALIRYGAVINGGTIAALNGATMTIGQYGATLDGSTSAGSIALVGAISLGGSTLRGAISNAGTAAVQPNANLTIGAGGVTLSGSGLIRLSYDSNSQTAGNLVGESGALLDNVGNTIAGAGTVSVVLDNKAGGTVLADIAGAQLLISSGATDVNAGLMEAVGGKLAVSNTTIDNRPGGHLFAGDGGVIQFYNATILGGSLQQSGTGYYAFDPYPYGVQAILAGVNVAATVKVGGNDTLQVTGDISNTGSLNVDTAGNADSRLKVSGAWTGSGSISLGATDSYRSRNVLEVDGSFSNGSGRIFGAGTITGTSATLTNTGEIDAVYADAALLVSTGSAVVNNGLLEAENGATLSVTDTISGTGAAVVTSGGTISFVSTFNQNVVFSGAGAGTLKLAQAYAGTISGFGFGDVLDLSNIVYAAGEKIVFKSAASGTRTFALETSGGAVQETLTFAGNYIARSFTIADDGSGHVAITSTGPSKAIVSHDFNADSVSDILFRNTQTGDSGYLTTTGSTPTYKGLGGSNTAYAIAGVGDFNGDGTSDILYRRASDGDFGYSALDPATGGSTYHPLGLSNPAYAVAGIGDFNADGTSDILYRNNTTGDFGYSALDPSSGNSTYHSLGASNASYAVVGVGDFNADGTSDILYRNNSTGDFGYSALNASTGGSTYRSLGGSNAAYAVVGVGDFNGDGTSDILYRNAQTGDFGYSALNPTTGGSTYIGLGLSNTAYDVVGTGDYNGDGLADVLFRNPLTGDMGYESITAAGQGTYNPLGGSNPSYGVF